MPDWLLFFGALFGVVVFICGVVATIVGIAGVMGAYDDDFW